MHKQKLGKSLDTEQILFLHSPAGVQLQDRDSEVQQLEDKLSDFKEIIEQQEALLEVHCMLSGCIGPIV